MGSRRLHNPLNQPRANGQGLYYLAPGFDLGLRAARITELLRAQLAHGRVGAADMAAIQADVTLFDASVFAPWAALPVVIDQASAE